MKKRKHFGATLTIIIITVIVMILSLILDRIGFAGSKTIITHDFLESTIVNVRNILSVEGARFVIGSIATNLSYFKPLGLLIIALISASIIESSGIITKMFSRFKKINSFLLTLLVVLTSMIFVFFGEYSFLLLLPIFALIYKELNKNPLLGIFTVFLAITIGFGAGVFINYYDYILGEMTQRAATVDIDPNYTFYNYSYMYVKIISLFLSTTLLAFLIEKYLTPKFPAVVTDEEEELDFPKNEEKALKISLGFLILYVGLMIYALFPNTFGNQILLDLNEEVFVAQLFSTESPFNEGIFLFLLLGFSITSYLYGTLTKKYREVKDFSSGFAKQFEGIGEIFVLIFFISQLLAILDWTNISEVFAIKLIEMMSALEFSGAPLIFLLFIVTIIIGILIPSTIEKWQLMSPVAVPLFMKANFTPEFSQIVFRAADGIGKTLTPLFPYYIVLLGFVRKYNDEKPITLFGGMRLMLPIVGIMAIFWLLLLMAFHIIGVPIGPDSLATL